MLFNRIRKNRWAVWIVIMLLVGVIITRLIIVNNRWKTPPINEYRIGMPVNSYGIEYTFSNFSFYNVDELCAKYTEVDPAIFDLGSDFDGNTIESVFVLVDVYCKNTSEEPVPVNFFEKMQLQVEDVLITCFDPYDLFPILNPDKPIAGIVMPGHDIKITLPFQLISTGFSDTEWKELDADTEYRIYFSIWPEQTYIKLN